MVMEATGLHVHRFLTCQHGGSQQIGARIAYNEMDMVLFFVDPNDSSMEKELLYISRLCDQNNIPLRVCMMLSIRTCCLGRSSINPESVLG